MNLNKYKKYDSRVYDAMNTLVTDLELHDNYTLSLDLLADNLELYYQARDDIKKNGFRITNDKGMIVKNPALQSYNNCQQTIIKLINSFPTNPLSKAKIKKLSEVGPDDSCPLDEFMK